MDKKALREYAKSLRESITYEQKKLYDETIFNKVIKSEEYKYSQIIFVFVSFGSEVDTHKIIIKALEDKKIVCVPKVINKKEGMKSVAITSIQELERSKYGILEPRDLNNEVNPSSIDLVLVPGLLFDTTGGRIGYGAGYYDKFLKLLTKESNIIGIGYKAQCIDKVPMEEHDVFLDYIITN
jgi:5-formyltetrahydrofolate cyclo-ligase